MEQWVFRLTVTDDDGATDTYDVTVPIGEQPEPSSWNMWNGTTLVPVTPVVAT